MTTKERILFIKPIGGLGNRMRAMDSAISLAETLDARVEVIWEQNRFLNAPFSSLFETIPNVSVRETQSWFDSIRFPDKSPASRRMTRVLGRLLCLPADRYFFQDEFAELAEGFRYETKRMDLSEFDDRMVQAFQSTRNEELVSSISAASRIYLSSGYRFYPSLKAFSFFRLPADIKQELDAFTQSWNRVIGVHIRRTDHKRAIEHSGDDLFELEMDRLIKAQPNLQFFLSTDDSAVVEQFRSRYGDRILNRASKFDRSDAQAIRDALIDMYLLSRTDRIIGSYFSSFSLTAAQIGQIDLLIP